jgi:hypothetical protein
VAEPLGVGGVGGVEGLLSQEPDAVGGAVVDRGWGVQSDPGMTVLMVVVAEELLAEGAGIGKAAEPVRKDRGVLQGLVRYAGDRLPRSWVIPAMTLCDWRARDFRALSCSRADRD